MMDPALITGLVDNDRLGHSPTEAGQRIVQHDDELVSIDKRMNHVAADTADTAGAQDCHKIPSPDMSEHTKLSQHFDELGNGLDDNR